MEAELEELAEMSKHATEREIETEVVHIFKLAGWPRTQINQDVPISDKGADKADIVLRLDGAPTILVEVKKHGHLRDADNQVNRYCRLLRPSPKLAFLTDGVRWTFYYVGQIGAIPIQEASVLEETADVAAMLASFNPTNLSTSLQLGAFQYLDIVEEGLQERSEDTQKHLRQFFTSTVKALLLQTPGKNINTAVAASPTIPQKEAVEQPQPSIVKAVEVTPSKVPVTKEYDPAKAPNLLHTSINTARFGQKSASDWNGLVRVGVLTAIQQGYSFDKLQRIMQANLKNEITTKEGFQPVQTTSISLQRMEANRSWRNVFILAKELKLDIEVNFRWQDKEQASHPGEAGILRWQP